MITKNIVIFTRASANLQPAKSCKNQERLVRAGLTRRGIDHSRAIAVYEQNESGTKVSRDASDRNDIVDRQ